MTWADDAVIYHLYPLGALGAPHRNKPGRAIAHRLPELTGELDRIAALGATAVLLGPVFHATSHGYDTIDYRQVDPRLGDSADLAAFSAELHRRGMRLILDTVFNHVGRDFPAFTDLQRHKQASPYADWFHVDFTRGNKRGDGFSYSGWEGHSSLVNLNLGNPQVRAHLFGALGEWVTRYDIDGLRLDAAQVMDAAFLTELSAYLRELRPDAYIFGEMVIGDYAQLASSGSLDAVTNYELYHALWTSHLHGDYPALAGTLARQFGDPGVYRGTGMFNFADNHDVERIATTLAAAPARLYPLYGLLFTLPGTPAVYYSSEWGVPTLPIRSDHRLRPALAGLPHPHPDLEPAIGRFARVRAASPALRRGSIQVTSASGGQIGFRRDLAGEQVWVAANNTGQWAAVGGVPGGWDLLNDEEVVADGDAVWVPPHWLRVIRPARG